MKDDHAVTDEQAEAALQILKAAGIDVPGLAEEIAEVARNLRIAYETVVDLIRQLIPPVVETLSAILEEIEENTYTPEPSAARRRKRERERAREITRRYMVQIRHFERVKHYRRIYKPP